jgi:alpha-L-rhamnosidase
MPTELNPLRHEFLQPPVESKPGVWWWWLGGAVSKEGITADLEAMRRQGISYAMVYTAGQGGPSAPKGSPFMSEAWRTHFRFAVQEAARLRIGIGVNVCEGWNCGGPWVTKEDAVKDLVWDETEIDGPGEIDLDLRTPWKVLSLPGTLPQEREEVVHWYRDVAVLACRELEPGVWRLRDIQDLTDRTREGRLRWEAPEGRWTVLRFGCAVRQEASMDPEVGYHLTKNTVSAEPGWEIDPMSAGAMDRHFAHTGAKLIEDAGERAGQTLSFLQIDSWEVGIPTWTEKFADEFRARRGYDPIRYLPALVGKTLDSADVSGRFAWDFRRTVADLIAQNYYGRLAQLCREHGLGTHCEAGGPFYTHFIDAMECQGAQEIPMAEFWSSRRPIQLWGESFEVVQGVSTPFFRTVEEEYPATCFGTIKQVADTAHVYGKRICQAESYTSTNEDWSEDPYFLKAPGDRAFCLGLNRQILSFYVHQSTLADKPGYEWEHVGTHFDRNITWFPLSHAWLTYLARCQHLLRQGVFAADIVYFAGQAVPNFALLDRKPIPGYDFDVINAQALLTRASARGGRLRLPDGVAYRYFVLPEGAAESITPQVLQKMRELVEGGVTLVGARPKHSLGLTDYPSSEQQVKQLADALWGTELQDSGTRPVGSGRVIWGRALEEVIRSDRLEPDVELRGVPAGVELDWLHRHEEQQDIYFVANLSEQALSIEALFRIDKRVPELWDPVTGEVVDLGEFRQEGLRTVIPLHFAAKQSFFIVFRRLTQQPSVSGARNFPPLVEIGKLAGPWEVSFDVTWGGPESVTFQRLDDWSQRPEDGIRYFSGKATYRNTFDLPEGGHRRVFLDLGEVKNVAQVRLNGKDLGVVWTAPWRVDVTEAVTREGNELEIDVVNLWPNRLIGDGLLPKERRFTKTNVRTYDTPHPVFRYSDTEVTRQEAELSDVTPDLLRSGLLGPVTFLAEDDQ